jgi:magnesium chelatase accessory protein
MDLPGHGFTRGADYARLDLAEHRPATRCPAGCRRARPPALVAGHSAGLPLALRWSLVGHQRAGRLVGFAPSLVPPPPADPLLLGPLLNPARHLGSDGLAAGGHHRALGHGRPPARLDRARSSAKRRRSAYRALFSDSDHVRGAMNFMAAADLPLLLEDAAGLATPTTLVVGDLDAWVPPEPLLQVIRRYLPAARVERWRAGHLMHETEPERAAAVVLDALGLALAADQGARALTLAPMRCASWRRSTCGSG